MGEVIEEGKWADFVVYWRSEGSDGEREEEDDRGEFKAEHGEDGGWGGRGRREEETVFIEGK